MIVVTGRVIAPGLDDAVIGNHPTVDNGIEPVFVGTILALLIIVQTVETNILQVARAATGGKGIGLCSLYRYLTPLSGRIRVGPINRHAALIEFLAIAEHVFTHLTEIEV